MKESQNLNSIQEVGCAIILKKPHILVDQRRPDDSLGGLWEFPGGTKDAHETIEECLVREVSEELRVKIRPRKFFKEKRCDYPGKKLLLKFYLCDWISGEPAAIECHAFKWVLPSELIRLPFIPADLEIIEGIVRSGPALFD